LDNEAKDDLAGEQGALNKLSGTHDGLQAAEAAAQDAGDECDDDPGKALGAWSSQ
jgi:hypothetical protein